MQQRGNILFMILLGIVLLAALAYAVSGSIRGSGKNMSDETAQAGAAAINNYIVLLRNEIQRLRVIRGCEITNLDFRTHDYIRFNGNYLNNTAPITAKSGCALFTERGGILAAQTFEKWKDAPFDAFGTANGNNDWKPGHAAFRWVNRKNELTGRNEIAILFEGIDQKICALLVNGSPNTLVADDNFDFSVVAPSAEPAGFTAAGDIIDLSANLQGDYFADLDTAIGGGPVYCLLGAIIIPQ